MPPVLATYELGDALLTVLSIFFMVIWIWILIVILLDLFRDHQLSGWWKAVWVFFLIFIPVITSLIYLIARGGGMRDRSIAEQKELQKATNAYIREAAGGSVSSADELHKLADLKDRGILSEEEFAAQKAKLLA